LSIWNRRIDPNIQYTENFDLLFFHVIVKIEKHILNLMERMLIDVGKLTKAIGVAGVAAGVVFLSKSENREKVKKEFGKLVAEKDSAYVKKLGKPGTVDDAKMVDEGALTSVQYYNKLQEEEGKEE